MKKIIAIVTIGATTAFLQVNAQETKKTEKETYEEAQQEIIDERAQPAADFEHNQYGTYPQGIDSTIVSQDRVEISKSDLPQEVLENFENSEYSDMEIVAIYEVQETNSPNMRKFSDDPSKEPEYENTLEQDPTADPTMKEPEVEENVQAEVEENVETEANPEMEKNVEKDVQVTPEEEPVIESETQEELTQKETETTLSESVTEEEGAPIKDRPSDIENPDHQYSEEEASADEAIETEGSEVKYEIKVQDKEENKQTTLVYTEEGELQQATEDTDM